MKSKGRIHVPPKGARRSYDHDPAAKAVAAQLAAQKLAALPVNVDFADKPLPKGADIPLSVNEYGEVERVCAQCGDTLPQNPDFFWRRKSKDGWDRTCKECRAAERRQRLSYVHGRRVLKAGGIHNLTQADLDAQWQRQDGRCHWCGVALDTNKEMRIHLDHLIPISKGGHNIPANVVYACEICNRTKHAKMPDEFAQAVTRVQL